MVALAASGAATTTKPQLQAVRVRVDLPALLRGRTEPGETCEIPGVGPVPVAHAAQILSHGLLQLVITDGVDVQTVVSNTRHVPAALKIAIHERDRACKVRGCDATHLLERHHTLDYARSHRTTYRELGNLCARHHDLVTHRESHHRGPPRRHLEPARPVRRRPDARSAGGGAPTPWAQGRSCHTPVRA